ncbi:putative phosphatidylcholine:ceramide cholinephosphotransferase 3 [Ditylenchus destructor]|nr:putative phosphatidylcholine:ceramide cholinephosphotransferase 3 [Ditylenchus destructor]
MPDEEDLLCPVTSPAPAAMGMSEIPLEPHKLAFVVVFLILAGFSNWIALAYIHDFVGREPLPDIIFSWVPEQGWALGVGDLMVTLCSASAITLFILHKHRNIVMRRTLFILGMLYTFRAITMLATQLPSGYADNNYKCRRQLDPKDRTLAVYIHRVLEQTLHVGLQDIEAKMMCGDLLYSGHTLVMVICTLTINHYIPLAIRWIRWVPNMLMLIGMCCMVISRTHYTIDVFFAYCFSVGVFTLYHAFCEIDTYRERKMSVLYKLWMMRIVSWLEENVIPGRIENKLEVPFAQAIYKNCFDPMRRPRQQAKSIYDIFADSPGSSSTASSYSHSTPRENSTENPTQIVVEQKK